jgi:5-deoxy-glucuronate isomerase
MLGFAVRTLRPGESVEAQTGSREYGIVLLGGVASLETEGAAWTDQGERDSVFEGMPTAFFVPRDSWLRLTAATPCEAAFCSAPAERAFPPRLVRPADVEVEIRGGANATRQINHILKPEFPADRLLIVEVYTPGGNWSSYPPHKHDVHDPPGEVDLEEIYYYKVNRPEGYAIQRVYTRDRRIDQTLTVRDGELVLIPEGYHPVVAAHGYDVYYLNALAGSARSMAASDDPDYAWVRQTWRDQDPRLPLVRCQP